MDSGFEQEKQKWEKQKAGGKARYVLLYTVFWAVLAVIFATLDILVFNRSYFHRPTALLFTYLIFVVFLGGAGLLSGFISWKSNLKKFDPETPSESIPVETGSVIGSTPPDASSPSAPGAEDEPPSGPDSDSDS